MDETNISATFWEHAEELRRTLIHIFWVIFISVVCALFFYQTIFQCLKEPLQGLQKNKEQGLLSYEIKRERWVNATSIEKKMAIPKEASVIQTSQDVKKITTNSYLIPPKGYLVIDKQVNFQENLAILSPIEGMTTTIKTCFWVGLAGSSPLWIFLILRFIAPAFEARQTRMIFPFLLLSIILVSLGILFAFYITIPLANRYLELFNQGIGVNFWSLSSYLDYTIGLLITNAVAFELFVIVLFLVHFGILTVEGMRKKRRHAIVAAFILGAILTPPDIITQILFAIPLIFIYEGAILYALFRKSYYKNTNLVVIHR